MKPIDILDNAMYEGITLKITTKGRGIISGQPFSVDEFETDPDRLGYVIMIDEHFADTVFLDEIVEIHETSNDDTMFFEVYKNLSRMNKQKAMKYVNDLLKVSS
jgi:hypothetical protein